MSGIPIQNINLSDVKYRAERFESFGRLREMGTLVPARIPLIGKIWLVTTYDAVNEVLKSDKLFCRDPRNAGKRNFLVFQLMLPGLFRKLSQNMIGKDEPDHRRLRLLVDQAFQRLLLAGHETTVHLISTSILTMLQFPDVKQTLFADWTKIDAAMEEMLRFNSSAQFAKPRWVTKDIEFYGHSLRRGEMVMPVLACANYDPARFEHPAEFQIDRPNNYHVTFGSGPHVCLGLKLAKAETQIVLERLFTRWLDLEPAFDVSGPDWAKRMGMRGLKSLRVRI